MKNLICAFIGNKPQNLPFGFNEADEQCLFLKEELERRIIDLIVNRNVTKFITGMGLGIDMFAAEIVIKLKKLYPTISLECAIPCESQPEKWTEGFRNRYFSIAQVCDKETMLQKKYTPDCIERRNRYMVDGCDILLAVWNNEPGDTMDAVEYARQGGKEIILIDPTCVNIGIL